MFEHRRSTFGPTFLFYHYLFFFIFTYSVSTASLPIIIRFINILPAPKVYFSAGRILIKSIIIVCLLNLMAWKASCAHRTGENKKKDNEGRAGPWRST